MLMGRFVGILGFGMLLWGCGVERVGPSPANRCVPGATQDCTCTGSLARGVQVCQADGTFPACVCAMVTPDVPPTEDTARPDSSVPPVDTAVPPPDTAIPPPDTAVPPPDTAVPPPDTGIPPPDTGAPPPDVPPGGCLPTQTLDLLFVVDNSNSMRDNQAQLAAQFRTLLDPLVNPHVDPSLGRSRFPPIRDLHVGVISTDLGTPGSTIPSCANSDQGDDGLLNPIRNGQALRRHLPWTSAPPGVRPARCMNDPNQYPSFLAFDAARSDLTAFREDFVCNAFLSVGGCGLEQQLESVYRALVVHNPRALPGNTDPNAGFVRDNALLGILVVSDEDDGSVRDCRYTERDPRGRPLPCTDALSVYDTTSPAWASSDLNLRHYLQRPGSAQDPHWPLDRYLDPTEPRRGFTSLKPSHPDWVVFGAIAGVPLRTPARDGRTNWEALLGVAPDGSDGYTGMAPEGPESMRQANPDPACSQRVVPACRREGTTYSPTACDTTTQYFAWPSRRIAQVAQRFDARYGNGVLGSICANNYAQTLGQFAERIQGHICP
ncbi:MAG: hypothetical protein HY909_02455 [Deltaproteobacteria bacterium]|nr:hypothetical protein [Deltaproteobacteria bacterium]